ncbi:glycosyltransferase family 2 protein [Pectobacterium versatile]|uniref:glycosyltransferase family 2 protein n=1 Tax=Pectobacterium versatile TaxID=2488639 RepID=UPI001935F987|nr:glycosyltransferase family 2 protein [Pectobacterium versatile]QQK72843.1 glycosyltransferase family 2 protein [Pectobacterium versatile]
MLSESDYSDTEVIFDFSHKYHKPEISFLIPTYKRPGLLQESIESIILIEDKPTFEIVVVDNDDSKEFSSLVDGVIKKYSHIPISLYRNKINLGMYGNWNMCIKLARGRWLTILNDDDKLKCDFIKNIWGLRDKAEVVIGKHEVFGELSYSRKGNLNIIDRFFFMVKTRRLTIGELFLLNPTPGALGVLFDSGFIKNIGGFDISYGVTADYHFYRRAREVAKILILSKTVALYRWSQNESLKKETLQYFIESDYYMRRDVIFGMFKDRYARFFFIKMLNKYTQYSVSIMCEHVDISSVLSKISLRSNKIKMVRVKRNFLALLLLVSLNAKDLLKAQIETRPHL